MKTLTRLLGATTLALLLSSCALFLEHGPRKILVFTKSSGFIHDGIKTDGRTGHGFAFRVLRELGAKHDIQFVESKDGTLFTPEYLAQFDAFLFYTSGDLTMAKSDPRGDGLPPMSP